MSGVFGNLFGSKPATTTGPTPYEQLPQYARDAFESAVNEGVGLSQDTSLFAPAPFTPQYASALEQLGAGIPQITGSEISQSMGYFQDPYQDQVIQNAIGDIQREGQGLYSNLLSNVSNAGAFGSTRQAVAEAEMGRNILEQIGKTSAGLRSQGFQDASNRALQLIGANRDLQQQGLSNLLTAGQAYQSQAQGLQSSPLEAVNYRLGLAQGVPQTGGETFQRDNQGALGRIGAASGGIAALGTLLSDVRAKDNISHIGALPSGLKVYSYNYKGKEGRHIGVIAQEAAKLFPDAVKEINGLLHVDYGRIS